MENQTCQKEIFQIMESKELPLWQKYTLTVEEVSRYFRIGQAKLRRLINENEMRKIIVEMFYTIPYTKTILNLHHFYTISLKKYAKL